MPEQTPTSASNPSPPPPPARRRRRWWVRVLLWLLLLGSAGLLVIAGGAGWAYRNRTDLTNQVLRQTFAAFDAQVGRIEVNWAGVEIEDIRVRDPKTSATIATVETLIWRPTWAKVNSGSLGRFEIEGVRVEATAEQLRAWNAERATEAPSPATPAGWRLPQLVIDAVDVRDVAVRVHGDAATPSIQFRLSHTLRGLDLTRENQPRLASARIALLDLEVEQPDGVQLALPQFETSATIREEDGFVEVGRTTVKGARIRWTPWMKHWLLGDAPEDTSPQPSALPFGLKGIALPELDVVDCEIQATEKGLTLAAALDARISRFAWSPSAPIVLGEQQLKLTRLKLQPETGGGGVEVPGLTLDLVASAGRITINSCEVNTPSIEWNQSLENALLAPVEVRPAGSAPAPRSGVMPDLFVRALSMQDASIVTRPTRLNPAEMKLTMSTNLEALTLGTAGISSDHPQKILVRDAHLAFPTRETPKPEPALTLDEAVVQVTPDEWRERFHVDTLRLQEPVIRVNPSTVPWLKDLSPSVKVAGSSQPAASGASPDALVTEDGQPWWQTVTADRFEINAGRAEYATSGKGRVEAAADFSVQTEPAPDDRKESPVIRLIVKNARGAIPEVARLPVAGLESIDVAVRLPDLWTKKHIESFKVRGGQIEVGDALMSLVAPPHNEPPPPGAPEPKTVSESPVKAATGMSPKWSVGEVDVGAVGVTLYKIAPGLLPVRFQVSLKSHDTPLDAAGLAVDATKQRIELTSLAIPSPYDPLRNVADLDTIFVDFSLEGLFAKRIDKVEIVSPTLFVGEDLFWYIDYYRKFAAGEIHSDSDAPRIAAVDREIALGAATGSAASSEKKEKGWDVRTLQVHAGKLVLAPKGAPLPGFKQPFPFSFVTQLDDGQFDATFDIPPDTYTLEDMKLEFRGMRGGVKFNLPIKGKDNNLTEVFRVDQIRWKQLHVEDAHLSVTYDMNGIYGQFGGAAYEGYVNGAFNIYLDQSFTWDGWIAGTGVKTTEITHKLCPSYFLLDGVVDGKVIAVGNSAELYQADIGFKNTSAGTFSIAALNDLIHDYAKETNVLTSQIARIGLETLRDFDYDSVDGEGRFYGREGKGHLVFKGPAGTRNIEINVLDHRWKEDRKPTATENATTMVQP